MPAKLDRCVADVKKQGGVDNPWAICNASINEEDKTIQETINSQIIESRLERGDCRCQKKKG